MHKNVQCVAGFSVPRLTPRWRLLVDIVLLYLRAPSWAEQAEVRLQAAARLLSERVQGSSLVCWSGGGGIMSGDPQAVTSCGGWQARVMTLQDASPAGLVGELYIANRRSWS